MHYTKESLEEKVVENLNKCGVSKEVQDRFKQVMWDNVYSNMLSIKGLYFVLTFISEIKDKEYTSFYSTTIKDNKYVFDELKEKLNKQGFIFYLGNAQELDNLTNNLFIIEPKEEFSKKIAFFDNIDNYLERL